MVNWSNYSRRAAQSIKCSTAFAPLLSLLLLIGLLSGCQSEPVLYKKTIPQTDHSKISEQLVGGHQFHYQGTPSETLLMEEAMRYDPSNPVPHRELGAPTVKRGMAKDFYRHYQNAVDRDPVEWQGWRGYLYLYFYRDYERALADFQALDTLTPDFVDYPQATSVLFMSALCYLQMGQYEHAISYFDDHIEEELKTVEESYIGTETFLFKGIAQFKQEQWEVAKSTFESGLRNADGKSADLWFWLSQTQVKLGDQMAAKAAIQEAKAQFQLGYFHDRPYVEEFFQTYWEQLLDWEQAL